MFFILLSLFLHKITFDLWKSLFQTIDIFLAYNGISLEIPNSRTKDLGSKRNWSIPVVFEQRERVKRIMLEQLGSLLKFWKANDLQRAGNTGPFPRAGLILNLWPTVSFMLDCDPHFTSWIELRPCEDLRLDNVLLGTAPHFPFYPCQLGHGLMRWSWLRPRYRVSVQRTWWEKFRKVAPLKLRAA